MISRSRCRLADASSSRDPARKGASRCSGRRPGSGMRAKAASSIRRLRRSRSSQNGPICRPERCGRASHGRDSRRRSTTRAFSKCWASSGLGAWWRGPMVWTPSATTGTTCSPLASSSSSPWRASCWAHPAMPCSIAPPRCSAPTTRRARWRCSPLTESPVSPSRPTRSSRLSTTRSSTWRLTALGRGSRPVRGTRRMSAAEPIGLASPSGLTVRVNANGSVHRIGHRDVIVNAYLGNEMEGGPANLFLRRRGARTEWTALLGPASPGVVRLDAHGFEVAGEWEALRFQVSLRLATSASAWFWHVTLENADLREVAIDLLYAQDLGLADYGGVRLNEYYISQYVDHTPLV